MRSVTDSCSPHAQYDPWRFDRPLGRRWGASEKLGTGPFVVARFHKAGLFQATVRWTLMRAGLSTFIDSWYCRLLALLCGGAARDLKIYLNKQLPLERGRTFICLHCVHRPSSLLSEIQHSPPVWTTALSRNKLFARTDDKDLKNLRLTFNKYSNGCVCFSQRSDASGSVICIEAISLIPDMLYTRTATMIGDYN